MENGEFLFVFGYFVFEDGLYRERESFFRHFKSVSSGTVKISGYQKYKDSQKYGSLFHKITSDRILSHQYS